MPSRLFLVFIFTLAIPATHGQVREPRTLSGTVYYAGGNQPAENVSVELHSTAGTLLAPQSTTSTGWFEFRGLQRVSYVIAINLSGFEPVNFSVDLSLSSSRGNVIYLKPLPSNSTTSVHGNSVSAHELSMPQKARDSMASGKKKLYEEKDAQGALAEFQEAVSTAPGYYEAYHQIAMAYLTVGRREDAEKNFRKSIEMSADKYGEADVGLGTMMLDKNDFAGGEKMIRHGIALSPDSWLGHYELGRALLNQNRVSEALQSAEQARSLAPNAPIVYRLLSNVHLRERDYPALLQDLDNYINLDSTSPAGVRAQQLRDQVQQKISADKMQPANPKP